MSYFSQFEKIVIFKFWKFFYLSQDVDKVQLRDLEKKTLKYNKNKCY